MRTLTQAAVLTLLGGALLALSIAHAQSAPSAALSTLRFQKLSVSVADLARASVWFQDVLGFKQVRTGEFPSVGAKLSSSKATGCSSS